MNPDFLAFRRNRNYISLVRLEKQVIIMRLLFAIALFVILTALSSAQDQPGPIASEASNTPFDSNAARFRNAWGVDILISYGGVGLGGFYRHEFARDVSGFAGLSVSEAKDEREFEVFDYYTQSYFTPGKTNRFLVIPLVFGVEQRLFSNQIMDNFRPYLSAALGPTLIYSTPYQDEFFSSLGKGHAHYTVGGYVGGGAYFGSDRSTLFGINIRYYFVPFGAGLESLGAGPPKKEFGGFFITINVGNSW